MPLIFWSFVYVAWLKYYDHKDISLVTGTLSLFSGPVYIHLWFFYSIMALYLATPILRVVVRNTPPG